MRSLAILAAFCVFLSLSQVARAQIQVSGTVVSSETHDPLPGVTVVIDGTLTGTITNQEGAFEISVRTADDVLVFSFVGYRTQRYAVRLGQAAIEIELEPDVVRLEEISVVADELRTFASNVVSEPMLRQQPAVASVAGVVDNLPGVSVQEGDSYGLDDWSSSVAMRGYQVTITDVQIGTTVDGLPNGTSDYWSGAKAGRFVDPANLGAVEVSQGTADIASLSVEALGGTIHYRTRDPADERLYAVSATVGEHDAKRIAMRIDTGPILGGKAHSWVFATRQESSDWVQGSARNEREHVAAKVATSLGSTALTSYFSHDRIHEDVYQRLYSDADFRANPRWDRLLGDWPGVPYLNQFYRPGWQTRRSNTFGYVRADNQNEAGISTTISAYFHFNRGRGDWLPPYIVDVRDDGGGPESELVGGPTVRGGEQLGVIRFVDRAGAAVAPVEGCTSSYIFNYYGAGGPEVDPGCHPGATAVQSYRHSHYGKDRFGLSVDEQWVSSIGAATNSLRSGLWYERSTRHLARDWHRILDPALSMRWDERAYWHQYEWGFPQAVTRYYVEDKLFAGPVTVTAGVRQFFVKVEREDRFGAAQDLAVESDSDFLLSGGVTYEPPVEGLRVFAGYAQNFKAIGSTLLEVPGRSLDELEPESASNIDVGLQYSGSRMALSGTWYTSDFKNRIFYLGPQTTAGPNYLIPGGGAYFNAGGISASGIELAATLQLPHQLSLYSSFTLNSSEYTGTGDPLVDASQGIAPGSDVTGLPNRLWAVALDRTGPLSAGVSAKYTSERRVSLAADWYADAYWMVDAYVILSGEALGHLLRSTEFSLVASNLLNTTYLSTITENAAWLGGPRTISMTTTVTF